MNDPDDVATVDASLRIAGGVSPDERDLVVQHCAPLDSRLRSFRAEQVQLTLSMKDRDTPGQHTTLEAHVVGFGRLVATSGHTNFDLAINEVRDDLIRQLTDAKTKLEPRNNKHLRNNDKR
jgi:ribosome-associated translation inhibitor RaiA